MISLDLHFLSNEGVWAGSRILMIPIMKGNGIPYPVRHYNSNINRVEFLPLVSRNSEL